MSGFMTLLGGQAGESNPGKSSQGGNSSGSSSSSSVVVCLPPTQVEPVLLQHCIAPAAAAPATPAGAAAAAAAAAGAGAGAARVLFLRSGSPTEEAVLQQQLGVARPSLPEFVRAHVVEQVGCTRGRGRVLEASSHFRGGSPGLTTPLWRLQRVLSPAPGFARSERARTPQTGPTCPHPCACRPPRAPSLPTWWTAWCCSCCTAAPPWCRTREGGGGPGCPRGTWSCWRASGACAVCCALERRARRPG